MKNHGRIEAAHNEDVNQLELSTKQLKASKKDLIEEANKFGNEKYKAGIIARVTEKAAANNLKVEKQKLKRERDKRVKQEAVDKQHETIEEVLNELAQIAEELDKDYQTSKEKREKDRKKELYHKSMRLIKKLGAVTVSLPTRSVESSKASSRKSSKVASPKKIVSKPPASPTPTHLSAASSKVTYDNEGIYLSNLFLQFSPNFEVCLCLFVIVLFVIEKPKVSPREVMKSAANNELSQDMKKLSLNKSEQ